MRLFMAISPPQDLIERIAEVQSALRATAGVEGIRWTRPDQFHYTLKFFGEQPMAKARKAVEGALVAAAEGAPFELSLGGVGAFPSEERPSVLWLGALAGAEALTEFAASLDSVMERKGFRREPRPMKAHLTLARIKSYRGEISAARTLAAQSPVPELGTFTVDRFALMQSITKSEGAEYSVVERFTLGG